MFAGRSWERLDYIPGGPAGRAPSRAPGEPGPQNEASRVVCSLLSFLEAGIPEVRVGETQLKVVNPDEAEETEGGGSFGSSSRA